MSRCLRFLIQPGTILSTSMLHQDYYCRRTQHILWYCAVLVCTVVILSGSCSASAADSTIWEIKKITNGKSYEPAKFAISLEEHNDVLHSSAYCMRNDVPNMFIRRLCSACADCEWKRREGFTTEEEWRTEVTAEMARLHARPEQIGVWLIGAPRSMKINNAIIGELESSLKLSLATVVKSATSRARYFVVSGTPNEVCPGLQAAGFTTFTPIPASLKVHPLLVELGPAVVGSSGEEAIQDIRVELAPGKKTSSGDDEDPPAVQANALATAWSGGLVATTVGHVNARVEAENEAVVTIRKLTRSEARRVAMSIALTQRGVMWINPMERMVTQNKYESNVVQGGERARADFPPPAPCFVCSQPVVSGDLFVPTSYSLWDMGIHGEGQVIAVSDIGLDWDHCFFRDADETPNPSTQNRVWESTTHRKIRQYVVADARVDDIPERTNGHGTHVCGTLAGNEAGGKESEERGIAFAAKLAFFDISKDGTDVEVVIPSPTNIALYPVGYRVGARIHNMSWGSGRGGSYTASSRNVDKYMWRNQDFIVVAAAGNYGDDGASSVFASASAKNVISVGASENPKVANAGSKIEHLTDFSSRGPTADGRIKPDVCAPGRRVASAKSVDVTKVSCGTSLVMSGTSMATPVISGAAALVRQYFVQGYYPNGKKNPSRGFTPMGALLKAVLVNSAQRMVGTEATRQGNRHPSMDYGFGLAVIDQTLTIHTSPPERGLYVDGAWSAGCVGCPSVVETDPDSSSWIYRVKLSPLKLGIPLKVTLVWSDVPGMASANDPTINDLDLTVELNNRIVKYPNGRNGPDRLNNVEHIEMPFPVAGATYNVRVNGTDVFRGPQPYAVVISGPFANFSVKKIRGSGHLLAEQPSDDDGTTPYMTLLLGSPAAVAVGGVVLVTLVVVVGVVGYRRQWRWCRARSHGGGGGNNDDGSVLLT